MSKPDYKTLYFELSSIKDIDILSRDIDKIMYSIDASIYQIFPEFIVIPKNINALEALLKLIAKHGCLATFRGAATGITGACLGNGVIIDTAKCLNRIIDIDPIKQQAIVEAGVVQDHLNQALKEYNLRLGPDTSTGNRATIGGMIGNNSAGARSLRYGMMVNAVESMRCILPSGEKVELKELSWSDALKTKSPLKDIYQYLYEIYIVQQRNLKAPFDHLTRRSSGYCVDLALSKESVNLAKLIVGSEGSLAAVTDVTLKLSKVPSNLKMLLIPAKSYVHSASMVKDLLKLNPLALEFIDSRVIHLGKTSTFLSDKLDWLDIDPEVMLIVELDDQSYLNAQSLSYSYIPVEDMDKMEAIWALRKRGLGLLLSRRSYSRAIAFIEDVAINIDKLELFFSEFKVLLDTYKLEAGIYGHIGAGSLHIRPFVDLYSAKDRKIMMDLMLDMQDLLLRCEGVFSGEHGDGKLRSWTNQEFFGKEIYDVFLKIKTILDPNHLFGRGNVIPDQGLFDNIRTRGNDLPPKEPDTFLSFSKEGGLFLSADLCNGNGECRKKDGLMCPSYKATHKEKDVTRGRAQALRSMILGDFKGNIKGDEEVMESLSLCLECKGCKKECPSNVDISKMKHEFLYQYYKNHRRPLRSYLFGYFSFFYKTLSIFPVISNSIMKSRLLFPLFKLLKIARDKSLPEISRLEKKYIESKSSAWNDSELVLYIDTYSKYTKSAQFFALINFLEQLGIGFHIVDKGCCGRPLISQGLLPSAKKVIKKSLDELSIAFEKNLPILVLEPSCRSVFTDDISGFFPSFSHSKLFYSFESWLSIYLKSSNQKLFLKSKKIGPVLIHRHCHSQSLESESPLVEILSQIENLSWKILNEGCCGQAGSFGYAEENAPIRNNIGQNGLLKHAQQGVTIIADGVSCQSQLKSSKAHILSLIEWINTYCYISKI